MTDNENLHQDDLRTERPKTERPASEKRFLYATGSRPLSGYRIDYGLGHGGFGEVYAATSDGGKNVALKLVRRNLDIELRGIRHCLNLKHPNLLALYDIRQDDSGDTWVVMDLMNGPSLEEVIARNPQGLILRHPGEAPAEKELDLLAWIEGITAGIAHLHHKGIVHRDLKPGNIFLDEGIVKIGDYGLSKFIACSHRSGHTESIGTIHYMAPEIANGKYGKSIDVYALGVILYEMITGRVPFDGESMGEILMKHLTADPDLSVLSPPFRQIVGRSLEKEPEKRYQSAEELHQALRAAVLSPGQIPPEAVVPPADAANGNDAGEKTDAASPKPPASDDPPLQRFKRWWGTLGVGERIGFVLLAFVALNVVGGMVAVTPGVIELVILAAAGYFFYYLFFYQSETPSKKSRPPQGKNPFATPGSPQARQYQGQVYHAYPADEKPVPNAPTGMPLLRQTLGSVLASIGIVAILSAMGMVVRGLQNQSPLGHPEVLVRFAWFASMTLGVTWTVLLGRMLATQWSDGKNTTAGRMTLALLSVPLSLMALSLSTLLVVPLEAGGSWLPNLHLCRILGIEPMNTLATTEVTWKMISHFVATFFLTMYLIGWGKLAGARRSRRIRVWPILWVGMMTYFITLWTGFPALPMVLVAVAAAYTVQMVTTCRPKKNHRDRKRHRSPRWSEMHANG